ncbi:hypothetical protein [Nitrosospira sp. Nsp13]|nr:hypothetical protein [Nitrosospira sp. Nsp13]
MGRWVQVEAGFYHVPISILPDPTGNSRVAVSVGGQSDLKEIGCKSRV